MLAKRIPLAPRLMTRKTLLAMGNMIPTMRMIPPKPILGKVKRTSTKS